jgi:polysaccharide export outer membrane protein
MARWKSWIGVALVAFAAGAGCQTTCPGGRHTFLGPQAVPADANQPRELSKVVMPDYVIEPPDVLQIDAVRVVPRPPYRIEPLDTLAILVTEALPQQPIQGLYLVEPEGTVNLGFNYGSVRVVDLTVEEAKTAIETYLRTILKPGYQVTVQPAETRGRQQIAGPHLVRQDGKVSLGIYGSVPVAGLTLEQAKAAIELQLSKYLLNPEVIVDVGGFNSKVYYVLTDYAGAGEGVFRLPLTGNETVLDAISQINGLPATASRKRIWVARPAPAGGCDQILPVDWIALSQRGETATNYQLLPGDRLYVQAQPLMTLDNYLAKIISPVERIFGITLLGNAVIQDVGQRNGNGNGIGGF